MAMKEITRTVAYLDDAGKLHETELEARITNFRSLCNAVARDVVNVDGTSASDAASLYRAGVEINNDLFEQYVEAARSIRDAFKKNRR